MAEGHPPAAAMASYRRSRLPRNVSSGCNFSLLEKQTAICLSCCPSPSVSLQYPPPIRGVGGTWALAHFIIPEIHSFVNLSKSQSSDTSDMRSICAKLLLLSLPVLFDLARGAWRAAMENKSNVLLQKHIWYIYIYIYIYVGILMHIVLQRL